MPRFTRLANRRDANENEIVGTMRHLGMHVWHDLPVDLLAFYRGQLVGVEVKDGKKPPSQRALTDIESTFLEIVGARGFVVCSVNDVIEMQKELTRRWAAR